MKINLLAAGALAVALAVPLGASAQQQGQPPATQSSGHRTPSPAKLQHRWMKRFGRLNLSGDQQQRIGSLINQYSQAHPEGSPPDRDANRELRRQLMTVLTPDQQQQYHQQMRERRAQMQQARGQMQQQAPDGQQGPPNYQQGPPNEQQGPPNDQHQGPPNEQQGPPNEQQGPPNDQQQGPPPDQQGPPNDQTNGPPPPFTK